MSAINDFIDEPMGPGLTGKVAPGQSVHPQAPQPASPPEPDAAAETLEPEPTKTSDDVGPVAQPGRASMSHPQDERRPAADPTWVGVNDGAEDDSRYDPSEVEATRARQQGLGVGARDLDRQRDAERPAADHPDRDDLTDPRTHDVDSAS